MKHWRGSFSRMFYEQASTNMKNSKLTRVAYLTTCYLGMLSSLVLLASRGSVQQEEDGFAMLLFLILAPITFPVTLFLGLCWFILQIIFSLGSVLP
jgi:hypothetical protein